VTRSGQGGYGTGDGKDDPFDPGEILIEIRRIGNVARVSAIATRSNVEITLVGDPRQGEAALKRAAARKLAYVLAKRRKASGDPQGGPGSTVA
jgi:hypothetical protein